MRAVNITTLGLGAKAALCWSFFWRGILATIGSMLVGGILGALVGFFIAFVGVPADTGMKLVQGVGFIVGALTGCVFLYVYVRWLLTARLGRFRLMLVHADAALAHPAVTPLAG